jgi:hypothetical protein
VRLCKELFLKKKQNFPLSMELLSDLELAVKFENLGRKHHALLACATVTFDTETNEVGLNGSSPTQINVPTSFIYSGNSDSWDGNYRVIVNFSGIRPPVPVEEYSNYVKQLLGDWGELT